MKNKKENAISARESALFFVLACFATVLPCAVGGEKSVQQWNGSFEVGFRYVDVDGSEKRYREDVDLTKGPRLFSLDIDIAPDASFKRCFDILNISAANVGGDPFESWGVTLKKFEAFNFRFERKKAAYYYSDGSDLHRFDYEHTFDAMEFDVHVKEKSKVFFNFDRQSKAGSVLDEPIDEIKDDYVAGAELWYRKFSVYADETYRDYANHQRFFADSVSSKRTSFDFRMPQTTLKLSFRPSEGKTINAGYVYSSLDGDLGYDSAEGNSGRGRMKRKIHIFDLGGIFDMKKGFVILADLRYQKLGQEVAVTEGSETDSMESGIRNMGFDLSGRLTPNEKITLNGGVRYEKREVHGFNNQEVDRSLSLVDAKTNPMAPEPPEQEPPPREAYEASLGPEYTTVFLSAAAQPFTRLNVYAEYEGSNYDNPFEIDRSQPVPSDGNGGGENGQYVPVPLVSYSDLHRFKARVRAGLTPALKIVGTFLRYDIDNKVRSSGLTSNRFSLTGTFRKRRLSAYAAYTRTDIHNTATKMITTIGPLASSFEWAAIDKADINGLLGGVTVEPRKDLTLGFRTDIQDNSGTYALGVREYEAFARITCSAGYGIRLAYMRRRYNEDRADTNDYGANIFTVGVGYEFGKQEKK